jgi:energy-coupling factor transport system permease protein
MTFFAEITLGRHVAGNSPLHRLDPRLKLVGLPLLVIAAFSGGPQRLLLLAPLVLSLLLLSRIEWRLWWRGIRVMRTLFVFTLALHLFFSPGRTLLGVAWLSLDGLLLGLLVCSRLLLAILLSSLLTLTTSPLELTWALSVLLAPLKRLGLAVQEWTLLLLLVLHFIPVLREEAMALALRRRGEGLGPEGKGLIERARFLAGMVSPLVLRLVERADDLAHAAVRGEPLVPEQGLFKFGVHRPLKGFDVLILLCGTLGVALLFLVT